MLENVTLTEAEIEARVKAAMDREPLIGDTVKQDGHEFMWDGGQWVHSYDCMDTDPPLGESDVQYRYFRRRR